MRRKRNEGAPPKFDPALAKSYIGKYILVGVTRVDHAGKLIKQEQLHGIIVGASRKGIVISLRGAHEGREWNMPPDFKAVSVAQPGKYTLRSTGEVVEDPDLLATWTIHEPLRH